MTAIALVVAVVFFVLVVRQGLTRVVSPEFMEAHVFITCSSAELAKYSHLVVVISSDDPNYVKKVEKHLKPEQIAPPNGVIESSLSQKKKTDLLLRDQTRRRDVYVPYSQEVKPQSQTTEIQIPTMFNQQHVTRLYALARLDPGINNEVSALGSAVSPAAVRDMDLVAQMRFVPESPTGTVQKASLELGFSGNVCGNHDDVAGSR